MISAHHSLHLIQFGRYQVLAGPQCRWHGELSWPLTIERNGARILPSVLLGGPRLTCWWVGQCWLALTACDELSPSPEKYCKQTLSPFRDYQMRKTVKKLNVHMCKKYIVCVAIVPMKSCSSNLRSFHNFSKMDNPWIDIKSVPVTPVTHLFMVHSMDTFRKDLMFFHWKIF